MSKGVKILIIILVVLIVGLGAFLAYRIYKQNNQPKETAKEETVKVETPKKEVQIFKGDDRPIAVMIDNHNGAWPQAGLNQAYIVYEIIVEGGETRLMALFKGVNLEKIGPVRSARHYFVDYVKENDAIYAHFGWSPQAESDIKKYSIDNINGISESSEIFWRVNDKYSPHNAVTSTEALLKSAKAKGYSTISTNESVLKYNAEGVDIANGQSALSITIPHSSLQTVSYEYDDKTQKYNRIARGVAQTDWDSGENVATTNIIIEYCDNYDLNDEEGKGRQGLENIGTFDGYYITKGKAQKIKCVKTSRDEKTKYLDLNDKEIEVNDGNTFIHICPKAAEVVITGIEEPAVVTTQSM